MTNKVRVVMITYNGEPFFESQLDSIVSQKHLDGVCIYDDCSDSAFVEKLKRCQSEKDVSIKLHFNEQNLGVIKNIKSALSDNLDAAYIALSDQDDVWEPNKIDLCLKELQELEKSSSIPALVYHDMAVIDEHGSVSEDSFWKLQRLNTVEHSFETNLIVNLVTGSASLMNSALAAYAKDIPEDLDIYHDAWLGMVAFTMGKIKCLKNPLSSHRSHPDSLTFQVNNKESLTSRINRNMRYILGKESIFGNQMEFIERFLHCYEQDLDQVHIAKFKNFLSHKKCGFLKQKRFISESLK